MANETFTVTEAIDFAPSGDTDLDLVIDPGETVRITVHITNNSANPGATVATGLEFSQILDGMTLVDQPGNDVNVSPVAFDDTYTAIGNTLLEVGNATSQTGPQSSVAGHVTDNDLEFFGDTFTVSAVQAQTSVVGNTITTTSANGGAVSMVVSGAEMGAFTYVSAVGFTGADTFSYTIRDKGLDGIAGNGDDLVNTATVTVNVTNQVWYVQQGAVGGDGTSINPFGTVTLAGAASGADDIVYVQGNAGGSITLDAGEQLIGTGVDLVVSGFTLAEDSANSSVDAAAAGFTVTLGANNTIAGIDILNAGGGALTGTGFGTLAINDVALDASGQALSLNSGSVSGPGFNATDSDGGTNNVNLQSVTGTLNLGGGALSGATGNAVVINGGNGSVDYNGTITHASNGHAIQVLNKTGGAVDFDGAVTSNTGSDGVFLSTNTGATINFDGGLTIDTSASGTAGFTATGGGTVTITDNGVVNNSIASGSGTALDLSGVTVGQAGILLETVSTSGANGVLINTVGQTVGSSGIDITGGTIASASTRGVDINATSADVTVAASIATTAAGRSVEVTGSGGNNTIVFAGTIDENGLGINLDNNDQLGGTATIAFTNAIDIDTAAGQTGFTSSNGGNVSVTGPLNVAAIGAGVGVNLTNNTGSTITFAAGGAGLDITSQSGTGFNATGGGTVNVTGSGNSINATSGIALNVNGTTIGAGDATFERIDSGAGANVGISLVNTGSSGGLKVTGSGTAGSGGTITGKTGSDGSTTSGIGIYLENTSEVSLDRMSLTTFDNHGIFGKSVNGIRVLNTTIGGSIGTSSGSNDAAVAFGTTSPSLSNGFANGSSSLFDNVNISGGIEHNFEVYQDSGTFNLTIQNSNIHDNSAGLGSDGLLIETTGTSHGIVRVHNTTFEDNKSQAVQANALGSSHLELTLNQNQVSRVTQGNEGFILQNGANADLTTAVTNNTFSGILGTNILVGNVVNNASASAELNATVSGNTMNLGVGGIAANRTLIAFFSSTPGQNSLSKVAINGNTINTTADPVNGMAEPLFVSTPDAGTDPIAHVSVTNNVVNITDPTQLALRGIAVQSTQDTSQMFAEVSGNDVNYLNGTPPGVSGIRVRQVNPATLQLETGSGSLAANNPLSTTQTVGTVTLVGNNVVLAPNAPAAPSLPGFLVAGAEPADTPAGADPVGSGTGADEVEPQPGVDVPGDSADGDAPFDAGAGPPLNASVILDDGFVSQAELDFVVDAAKQRWIATGLTAEQTAAIENVSFRIVAMSGLELGSFDSGVVSVDLDGAGRGWFVDATPLDDVEFANAVSPTRLVATSGTAAAGRFDLLTTIMHEMGHALGLGDLQDPAVRDDLLYGYLYASERRLPGGEQAQGASPGSVTQESFAGSLIEVVPDDGSSVLQDNIFALPPGKTVDIQWDATIDQQTNGLIVNPTNSGTVTATNVAGFGDTASNVVTTTLDTLTLGGTVWNDNGAGGGIAGNGWFDGAEPGVDGVALTLFADNGTVAGAWDASDALVTTATTAGGGSYSFTGLAPGDYLVRVDLANFTGALSTLQASSTTVPEPIDPDDNFDNDDNGARGAGEPAYSGVITLSYNDEPGGDTNATLDLAFRAAAQAPTLTATALDPTFTEDGAAAELFGTVASSTVEAGQTFASLTLTVSDVTDGAAEILSFDGSDVALTDGNAVNTATNGLTVTVAVAANLATVSFSGAALSQAALETLIDGIAYRNASQNPTDGDRAVTLTQLVDSGPGTGGDDNTATLALVSTVNVDPVADSPVAQPDAVTTAEDAVGTGNVLADNGSGADLDVDGPALAVSAVNGSGGNVGTQLALASGALLTLNADGTYSYDPNGKFDYLIASATAATLGAANDSATDTFSYTLSGGNTVTVTMTVTGVDGAGDQLWGGSGNDIVSGTAGGDLFNLGQGGDDTVTGFDTNDAFYFGAEFGPGDSIDGGGGNDDQLGLQGNYGAPFVLGANHLVNVETLALMSGSDARFGDTAGNFYSYNIATIDANVGAGQRLIVNFNTLRVGENVIFDGSAETDGAFLTYGGQGNDTLTGGDQSDWFYFGNLDRWGAGDSVVGGDGADDQLGLQGSYTVAFGAGQLTGIESLALLTGGDTRFGNPPGTGYSYDLTMHDGNVAPLATLIVNANTLRADVPGVTDETLAFDGSAESDGRFTIYSGAGDDTLIGGDNDDTLYGAGGADTMTGGLGNDRFAYMNAAHSTAAEMDQVLDFTLGDLIDLGSIDAIVGGANDAFAFIGSAAFSNTAGQLRLEDLGGGAWQVQGDTNGDSIADLVIAITAGHTPTATDFIL